MDALDQNKAINKAGRLVGKLKPIDNAPKQDALQARALPPRSAPIRRRRRSLGRPQGVTPKALTPAETAAL